MQLADFRNFGHGRHNWLAHRGRTTGVLALVSAEDKSLATRTLNLIPSDIQTVRVDVVGSTPASTVESIILAMYLTLWAAKERGIDPGKPGVPEFGRKIYRLGVLPKKPAVKPRAELAVERKLSSGTSLGIGEEADWARFLEEFLERLGSARFGAAVFDYDGTLCDRRHRFDPLPTCIRTELDRLLDMGVLVGVASGRGKSVSLALRDAIRPDLWARVIVGSYNGSVVSTLDEDLETVAPLTMSDELSTAAKALATDPWMQKRAQIEPRPTQISLEPSGLLPIAVLFDEVQAVLAKVHLRSLRVMTSKHSVDILSDGMTKSKVVAKASSMVRDEERSVLCIGDSGRWPGNDWELLQHPFSLSVDKVSVDPETCWNLAPSGHRGPQATLDYLRAMRPPALERNCFQFDLQSLSSGWR